MLRQFVLENRTFTVTADETLQFSISAVSHHAGIDLYQISVSIPEGTVGTPIKIQWQEPMQDIYCSWMPLSRWDHSLRQWFNPNRTTSCFCLGTPVLATVRNSGHQSETVCLSDARKPMTLSFHVDDLEQKDLVGYDVVLFDGQTEPIREYETFLRIDTRDIPYDEALQEAGAWMRSFLPGTAVIPEDAEMPLYSSWYNFHQAPNQPLLMQELDAAAKLGFRTVILDDGWQFAGNSTGDYRKCGDWTVSKDKFEDFNAFVQHAHKLGLKLLVWFSVPFVGYEADCYARFQTAGQFLYHSDEFQAAVLDIRFPEVRQYILGIYRRFTDQYGLDGLKLDFVDSFKFTDESQPYCQGMDCETVEKAVQVLLDEIYKEMTRTNPDFLLEFRQSYIGTEILNRCSMIRVGDCAFDPITNRIGLTALRLLSAPTAVHADMLLWGKNESPENCARQLLNILFAVPQISVLLTEIPKEQLKVVQYFVRYWLDHREVLLHGAFHAPHPEANYSLLSAQTDAMRITVLYTAVSHTLTLHQEDIFNCTDTDTLILDGDAGYTYRCYDCFGTVTAEGTMDGLAKLTVPIGGHCTMNSN